MLRPKKKAESGALYLLDDGAAGVNPVIKGVDPPLFSCNTDCSKEL